MRGSIGLGASSTDEDAGTKAGPCFRSHCWSGPLQLRPSRNPIENLKARLPKSLEIRWTQKPGRRLTETLSMPFGAQGWSSAKTRPTLLTSTGGFSPLWEKGIHKIDISFHILTVRPPRSVPS